MPLISETNPGTIQQLPDSPEMEAIEPSIGEVFGAGFRIENSLVSAASNGFGFNQFEPEEGFDPYQPEVIKGYELWAENFMDVKSSSEMSMVKSQIDNELQDKQTLDAGGVTGFVAQVAAGITDPLYWPLLAIPGGAAIRSSTSVGQSAAKLAAIGGISEIPAEAVKQSFQETRTGTDSMLAIGGATVLSGILGGVAKSLSTAEINTISKKLDEVMSDADTLIVPGNSKSLSAAESVTLSKAELKPVSVGGLEAMGVSPLLRAENSPSVKTRQLSADMMESATVKQANVDGKATIPEGGSAETRIKMWDAGLYQGLKDLDKFYTAYRGGKGTTSRIINDYVMRNKAGKLSPKEFREEVGRVARRGDVSTIPEVQQAAESFRKNVFDPLKEAAIREKLLPPGVEVSTATSYLTRVYNTKKIAAKRPEWNGIVESWLTSNRTAAQELRAGDVSPKIKAEEAGTVFHRTTADEFFTFEKRPTSKPSFSKGEGFFFSKSADDPSISVFGSNIVEAKVSIKKPSPIESLKTAGGEVGRSKIPLSKAPKDLEDTVIGDLNTGISHNDTGGINPKLSKKEYGTLAKKAAKQGNLFRVIDPEILSKQNVKEIKEAGFDGFDFEGVGGTPGQVIALSADQVNVKSFTKGGKKSLPPGKAAPAKDQSIIEAEAALTDLEIKHIAEDITNNIMGIAAGRVPYEIIPNVRGPLKERTFNIPDRLIEDFLESDIDIVARQYKRTMAPDVELTRLYGKADMEQELEDIASSYTELIDKAKTEKERTQLTRKLEQDQIDISAMRDRLRGSYRTPEDPNSFFVRAGRVLRDVNFVRMLGGMTLSAIPDLARPIAVNGLRPVSRGLMTLATSPKRFGMAKDEVRRAAVGLDMVLNGRAASMAELTDIYNKGTQFERGLRQMSDAFGKMTLMSQWNTALKTFSGVITQDRILAGVVKLSEGKASKSMITRLAASGIGVPQAKAIAKQFQKHGDTGSLNLSNGHLWDNHEALEVFRAAVLKDVDRTIVTPGLGEKPLWTSSETGKLIFQFKTFAASAHNKILVADLQYRDAEALNGFLLSVAFGTAAYGAKEFVAGREISSDPKKLIVESLDRSGVFGYFWDANNIVEKMTRGEVGVNKAIGAPPMSRYASRNIMGALLGPSAGTIEDLNAVTGAIAQGEFTESDLRRVRKLLPGQNLFYIRQLLNTLEKDIGAGL